MENSHGRHFEEFAVGDTVTSGERTLRQEDILAFAEQSGDHTRLHTDEAYARQGPFGRTVAHGLLGLSVASGLLIQLGFLEGTLLAFRDLTWKFSLPVFPGDTIHVLAMVAELKALPRLGGGAVTLAIEVINQDGQTVQSGSWMVLVASKTRNS